MAEKILNYVFPPDFPKVVSLPDVKDWENDNTIMWLHKMVEANKNVIFFWTVPTTDIWEDEEPKFNYNTTVHMVNGRVYHTYSEKCHDDCRGQYEDCYYKQSHEEING